METSVIILGVFGLFTLLFNGIISGGVLLASLSAIGLGAVSIWRKQARFHKLAILLSAGILWGSVYDLYAYLRLEHYSGNSYGTWVWSIPLLLCSAAILLRAQKWP